MEAQKTGKIGYLFNIQKFCLHDGAGIRTDLFFQGCSLHCAWCANPESRLPLGDPRCEARAYTVEEVVREALKDKPFYDKSGGGVTLTGGEVFAQQDFAEALCGALHAEGISVAMETAACVSAERFAALAERTDFVFADCKHYDSARHRAGTGAGNERILRNIAWLAGSGIPHCIRIPVIPGFNDSPADARGFCALFEKLGVREVQLLPFHQLGERKYADLKLDYAYAGLPQMHEEDLIRYRKIFEECGIHTAIGG